MLVHWALVGSVEIYVWTHLTPSGETEQYHTKQHQSREKSTIWTKLMRSAWKQHGFNLLSSLLLPSEDGAIHDQGTCAVLPNCHPRIRIIWTSILPNEQIFFNGRVLGEQRFKF